MLDSRQLGNSLSFDGRADSWAQSRGILSSGTSTILPEIIGMPSGSTDLGAFNIGIILNSRNIKQAFQDIESAVSSRLNITSNLSDLPDKATARANLNLGSVATQNTGTSGATIPLLNGINTWGGKQTFDAGMATLRQLDINGVAGQTSNLVMFSSANRRWAIIKGAGAETGSNVGSDFAIARYADDSSYIESSISISRGTGVVTLSKPLPVGSGGTGVVDLTSLKSSLTLNNVDNTRDIDKPIGTATQNAIASKLDKVGGSITGNLNVDGYVRAGNNVIINGNSSEGGQLIICYRNVAGVTGQANGTWNVDVDGSNNLRFFVQRANGTQPTPYLVINEAGGLTAQSPVFNGTDRIARFIGSNGTSYSGVSLTNLGINGSTNGYNYLEFQNENSIPTGHFVLNQLTNGSSSLDVAVTAAGNRTQDRRINVMRFESSVITANVPINGRAYPRRSDGADLNFNFSPQASAPSYILGTVDGITLYPYNPAAVSVNYATTAGSSARVDVVANGIAPTDAVYAQMADNDFFRIRVGGTATNAGWVELATADDGNEPIYVRQYSGPFSSLVRTATLLDASGNTQFPGGLYAAEVSSGGWFHPQASAGIIWDNSGRQLVQADNGGSYGNVGVKGSGLGGWSGYTIGNWATFMANGSDCGIYSQQYGNWLLRFDAGGNATFPQNVTAYSDERLKSNIRKIDSVEYRREGLANAAMVYELNGKTHIGFGAQTLEPINPELVTTADDLTNTKSVCYSEAIPILAMDNQILSDRLDAAESLNKELMLTVESLIARLEKAGL